MANDTMITPQAADEAIVSTIALFMGRGRRHSVADVSFGTRIAERTLHAMIAAEPTDRRRPTGQNLLLLASFFGTEFTDRLLSHIGQGARDLHPAEGAPSQVIATLMSGVAEFAKAGADGRFCHRDRGELADDAAEMIGILEPFACAGSATAKGEREPSG